MTHLLSGQLSIDRYRLPWETLEALLRGISSIDLVTLQVTDRQDAYDFIHHYGYDLNVPSDAKEIQAVLEESVRFINYFLLDCLDRNWVAEGEPASPASEIPESVIRSKDVLDLILLAANGDVPDRDWACAILKVMHTLTHIQHGPFYYFFEEARQQILSKCRAVLQPINIPTKASPIQAYRLGSPGKKELDLFSFETKDKKTRESILVKLLCKKEHVAESIWDLVGIRFITHTPAEAVMVLEILRDERIIVFPNIIPSRSRNSLVDFSLYRTHYEAAFTELTLGKITPEQFEARVQTMDVTPGEPQTFNHQNKSTSEHYRSIHITCRQLIRIKPPDSPIEHRFFFPYEIQILDKQSFLESKEGSSAHSLYKRKQLATARRRVLGNLLQPG